MFSFSFVLVILVGLSLLYWYIMKGRELSKKEVVEKVDEELKEIDELAEKVKKVDPKKVRDKKKKIDEVKNL